MRVPNAAFSRAFRVHIALISSRDFPPYSTCRLFFGDCQFSWYASRTASASNGAKHGFRRLVPLTTRRDDGTTSCEILFFFSGVSTP